MQFDDNGVRLVAIKASQSASEITGGRAPLTPALQKEIMDSRRTRQRVRAAEQRRPGAFQNRVNQISAGATGGVNAPQIPTNFQLQPTATTNPGTIRLQQYSVPITDNDILLRHDQIIQRGAYQKIQFV
jgi:hypothetical protein